MLEDTYLRVITHSIDVFRRNHWGYGEQYFVTHVHPHIIPVRDPKHRNIQNTTHSVAGSLGRWVAGSLSRWAVRLELRYPDP